MVTSPRTEEQWRLDEFGFLHPNRGSTHAPVTSVESNEEAGETETHEPSRSQDSDGNLEALEDSEPEEWEQDPEFAEFATFRRTEWGSGRI